MRIVLWLLLFRIGSEIVDFDTPALNLSSCGGTVVIREVKKKPKSENKL